MSRPLLYITEKSSTLKALKPHLGPGEEAIAASGHLLTPKYPDEIDQGLKAWSFDTLPIIMRQIPLKIATDRSGRSQADKLHAILAAIRSAHTVVVATDPGREGSLIAWELLVAAQFRGPVWRLKLGAINASAIKKHLAEMRTITTKSGDVDYCWFKEALARQIRDWHSGMNGTRALNICRQARPRHSYGEVIMPTLALLAELEIEIQEFKSTPYYKVSMKVATAAGALFTMHHIPERRITEKRIAEVIQAAASTWTGALRVETKTVGRQPPPLFSLSTLQAKCAKLLGLKPDETERYAQACYDAGALSYPRTSTNFIHGAEASAASAILDAISATQRHLAALKPTSPTIRRGYTYQDKDAEHYAIIPTTQPLPPDLPPQAAQVYQIVAERFVAHHLPDAIDQVTTVAADVAVPALPKPAVFRARGTIEQNPGWRRVYQNASDAADEAPRKKKDNSADDPPEAKLPALRNREIGRSAGAAIEQAMTEPPKRITIGELPNVMKRLIDWVDDPRLKEALKNPADPNDPKGLGTEATRQDIAKRLIECEYIVEFQTKAGRRPKDPPIQVTGRGISLYRWLKQNFSEDADPVARAVTESELIPIGKAPSRAEADRLFNSFVERAVQKQNRLVQALKKASTPITPTTAAPTNGNGAVAHRPFRPSASYTARLEGGTPLKVAFADKDKAKSLGAVWDGPNKRWLAPQGVDLSVFKQAGFL